jgi:peroxiredoxin
MSLKSAFISLWISALMVALVHAAISLVDAPQSLAWWAVVLALLPSLLFFMRLFLAPIARTAEIVWPTLLAPLAALVLLAIAWPPGVAPWLYVMLIGLGGNLLYQFWYSKLDRQPSKTLAVGATLPPLVFDDPQGQPVSTDDFEGPLLLIFYRGNWCPLCMAQIREVAAQYKALAERGVNTLLISPQPHDNSRDLALRFDVPFQFLVDRDHRVAKELEIFADGGVPLGMEVLGYDSDTVFPTVVATDAQRRILLADQTDNYRLRPEPETFLRVFA